MIKLSEWAAAHGVTYRTAWNWIQRGKFPLETAMSPTGRIFVVDAKPAQRAEETTVLYCRVSNHSRKQELDYQVDRCKRFAEANGWTVAKAYKEVASGMNDKRPQMWKAIETKPTRIVVENKDRLTRFGFEYLKRLCQAQGTSLVVINEDETDKQDLVKDLCSVIYSFCARLYGLRRGRAKAQEAKAIITD